MSTKKRAKPSFWDELAKLKGQFFVTDSGTIRCEDYKDVCGDFACPIVAVATNLGVKTGLHNSYAYHMRNEVGLDDVEAELIIVAADNRYPDGYVVEPVRKRLLETCI